MSQEECLDFTLPQPKPTDNGVSVQSDPLWTHHTSVPASSRLPDRRPANRWHLHATG